MHTSTAVTVVHGELKYLTANQIFTVSNVAHAFLTPLMKNTVSTFDWFLFWFLHTGPHTFKPRTSRTNDIGAFRESQGAVPPAGPVVDYRTHLHVIQSNPPKPIKLHPPFFFLFSCIFTLLSRESDQCAIPARLGVAGHLSTTPRWGIPLSAFPNGTSKPAGLFYTVSL